MTKELLVEKLINFFNEDLLTNLNNADMDEEEKNANIVLSRKRIATDAENISDLVFKAFA